MIIKLSLGCSAIPTTESEPVLIRQHSTKQTFRAERERESISANREFQRALRSILSPSTNVHCNLSVKRAEQLTQIHTNQQSKVEIYFHCAPRELYSARCILIRAAHVRDFAALAFVCVPKTTQQAREMHSAHVDILKYTLHIHLIHSIIIWIMNQ